MEPIVLKPYRINPKDTLRWSASAYWRELKSLIIGWIILVIGLLALSMVCKTRIFTILATWLGTSLLFIPVTFYSRFVEASRFYESERQFTIDENRIVVSSAVLEQVVVLWVTVLILFELPECYVARTLVPKRGWLFSNAQYTNLMIPKSVFDDVQMAEFQKILGSKGLMK
jgi:hypothetical protein